MRQGCPGRGRPSRKDSDENQAAVAAAGALAARLALAVAFFFFKYRTRRFFFSTLLYCLPITIFTLLACSVFVGGTMVISSSRFNLNLALLIALAALAGCSTSKESKVQATLRVHLEVNPDQTGHSEAVPIYRATPIFLNVQRQPFLTEAFVEKAAVLDTLGGFALQVQFDHMGSMLLEQYSAQNPGKHFAVAVQFGEKTGTARWLAAPSIGRRISTGTLVFTPDCTREEAEQIALGLNNVVTKAKKRSLLQ
jgi:hypothetical protein